MIRILHVIDRLKKVSGIAQSILNYYNNIDISNIQFDFLVVDVDSDIIDMVRLRGGNVYIIDKLGMTNLSKVKMQIEIFFSQKAVNYRVVHSSFYQIDFLVFPIAKKYGVEICIAHSHNTRYADYWLRSIRNCVLSKLSVCQATHFMACSQAAGEFLFGSRWQKNFNTYVLNNAIEASLYSYDENIRNTMRKELNIENAYVIGHVGRFNKQKNHQFLIDVFMCYHEIDSTAVLLLVGEGELMDSYKKMVDVVGASSYIHFLGARKDVPHLLQAMDCYVFPSLYEGLGIALVEAQAAGLPCVASSTIPIESKVTDNIVYLPLNNKEDWIREIELRKKIKRINTYEIIATRGYDLKVATKELERYYDAIQKK